jgi:hypothetical protein
MLARWVIGPALPPAKSGLGLRADKAALAERHVRMVRSRTGEVHYDDRSSNWHVANP